MQPKSIHTLVEDVTNLWHPDTAAKFDKELMQQCLMDIGSSMQNLVNREDSRAYRLRPSCLGKGLRWHWYMAKGGVPMEKIDGQTAKRFNTGHISEAMLIAYIKLAGHTVEHEQLKVSVGDISGSLDCLIDGALIDIKTASSYGFKKFSDGTISPTNDPYGYIAQLSFYKLGLANQGIDINGQGWFAINKNDEALALHMIPDSELIDVERRIALIREQAEKDTPPEDICEGADPVEEKSGNMQMSSMCKFCPAKEKCWPEFKAFRYANGDKLYTKVTKQPRVEEVTHEYRK